MPSRPRHPRIEALLQRILLSVSVVKETLSIEGTGGRDEISLAVHPQVINLMSVKVNGDEKVFLLGSFKVININTLAGNDFVRVGELYDAHPAYLNIDLGPGNDRAYGSAHDEKIIGGTGNDRIAAGAGDDYVNAGAGNDVLVGDSGNDTLIGLAGNDAIYGGAGKDQIFAGDGADSLDGGDDADVVDGGWGNDRVVETDLHSSAGYGDYERNANLINGGAGDDYIQISDLGSRSTVFGGDGNDYLYAKNGGPYIGGLQMNGEAGDDKIISPVANGGAGNDTIVTFDFFGETGVNGGDGDDRITVVGGSNGIVNGGNGNDVISNERSYNLSIHGDAGNDFIATNGRAEGGAGNDLLRPASGYFKGDVTPAAVDFSGGDGNDLLIGSVLADSLQGDAGDDILQGGASNDSLEGGDGDDVLFGGSDIDTLRGSDGNDSLFAGDMNDANRDDDGKDYAYGEEGRNYFDKRSNWTGTDRKKKDSTEFKTEGSGALIADGILTIDANGAVNFDDLLNLAHNYGGLAGGSSTWSSSSGAGYVSFDDLLALAQDYDSTVNPTHPTTNPNAPIVDDAIAFHGKAAIFSGRFETSTQPTSISLPTLAPTERKSVRGMVVHVPTDWTLTRVGKKDGLLWYETRLTDGSRTTVFGGLLGKLVRYSLGDVPTRESVGAKNLVVTVMGLHPSSVVLFDAAASSTVLSSWIAPAGFNAGAIVKRSGVNALLCAYGEMFSIDKPRMDELANVSLAPNQKYLYTAQGLRPVSANGIGSLVA